MNESINQSLYVPNKTVMNRHTQA